MALHRQLKYRETIQDYSRAIEQDKNNREARIQRAMAYLDFGENLQGFEKMPETCCSGYAGVHKAHSIQGLTLDSPQGLSGVKGSV